jgi:methylenetetrahydrofolate--tRNA-(uracil-5-)-methyltransferase
MKQRLTIIGGGLAGCEAAWQAAESGIEVDLFEMRPAVLTGVHKTDLLAELVCSNSLGTNNPLKTPGLLKEELRKLGSLLIKTADFCAVPAGQALAVNREEFSKKVTDCISRHPCIHLIRKEVRELPEGVCIVATGPLTSPDFAAFLKTFCGDYLYYYDAVSPIVTRESLDFSKLYHGCRYGRGDDKAYLNSPLTKEEYCSFVAAVRSSERVPYAPHEPPKFFEGCMPIEEKADRGFDTLRFGALKPVGLPVSGTGREPYAAVQLRLENKEETMYNLVGFQTRMKRGEQERVFRMIPGLEQAEFVRYGVMHRNLFISAPVLLYPTLQLRAIPTLFFAGQITGVEGYVEDIASGFLAGVNAARFLLGREMFSPPSTTGIGSLIHYITHANPRDFQPMNINFSLFPPLAVPVRDKVLRQKQLVERAARDLEKYTSQVRKEAAAL